MASISRQKALRSHISMIPYVSYRRSDMTGTVIVSAGAAGFMTDSLPVTAVSRSGYVMKITAAMYPEISMISR